MVSRGRHVGPRDLEGDHYMSNAINDAWRTWKAAMACAAMLCTAEGDEAHERGEGRASDSAHDCAQIIRGSDGP